MMEMDNEYREYSLSRRGQELAEADEVREILGAVKEHDECYPWVIAPTAQFISDYPETMRDYYAQFTKSQSFKELDQIEKTKSRRAFRIVNSGRSQNVSWQVESSEANGNPKTVRVIRAIARDALLVCGITLDDLHRVAPGAIEKYCELGFENRLAMADYIGACILSGKDSLFDTYVDFSMKDSEGIDTVIGIGGDMNGDFRIRQYETYPDGSIDPVGRHALYAPKGIETHLGSRDKAEPLVVVAVLKHLHGIGWTDDRQKAFVRDVLDTYDAADDGLRGRGPFGEFGAYDGEYQSRQLTRYLPDEDTDYKETQVLDMLGVSYGESLLTLLTDRQDLVMKYGKRNNEFKWEPTSDSEVRIPEEYLKDFMLALLGQAKHGYGRTADYALINILKARLETDWH